jgi:DHA1 family tetracycline resistance protein-like MFS transporter
MGIGIVLPITPTLVQRIGGLDPSHASFAVGAVVASFALAQLFAAPVLGALSDRYGRRPVLLLSIAGIACNYVLLAWAPSLAWLYLGRFLGGATSANVSTVSAYIADVTPPEERSRRFGLIGATFGFSFVFGPALGGWLGGIDIRLPFWVAAGLAGANALYGYFVLPESLPPERRRPFAWRRANPFAALAGLSADGVLRRLGVAWACTWFGLGALQATFVLSMEYRFGWGPAQNGALLAFVGLSGAVIQGFLVRKITGWLGDRRTALLGYAFGTVSYALLGVAAVPWLIWPGVLLHAFGQIANPSVRALVSGHAGPDRQGVTFGALSTIEGMTAIAAPVIASALFAAFTGAGAWLELPGAPFLAASGCFLLAFATVRALSGVAEG